MANYKYLLLVFLFMMASVQAMDISFFEEFPQKEDVKRLAQLDFPTTVYLASENLSGFYHWRDELQAPARDDSFVYWPLLERDAGYWISPWADSEALTNLFDSLRNREDKSQLEVMLDMEFPKNKSQIWKRRKSAKENRERIKDFIKGAKDYNLSITTVEKSYFPDSFLQRIGMAYPSEEFGNKRIKMYYTSFQRKALPSFIVNHFFKRKVAKSAREGVGLGIGLIAPGVYGFEPTYPLKVLDKELQFARNAGVKEVIIFRLGGLEENVTGLLNEEAKKTKHLKTI